ncbi:SagB family peptide dehydrogenase [Kibdelosporangium philippinense]|uniref:SagB family peptide dehydrogenase n=1 Tax=Kibdelosporangium philippinense TaxID=211113 RepID=A0ABS8Z3M6_9PSEU|nr:SagB family peptide dehydrogenase [Kibdelosporangium philippinense]MCE7001972.1 SagB family peptide dehydrogenase [Kibdelosporangium philippinense]
MSLAEVLTHRKSSYRYGRMSTEDLGTLLSWAAGPQRMVRDHQFSMAPSAGGLPSLDMYVIARDISGVRQGVHRYSQGTLSLLLQGDPAPALRSALLQPEFADRAAAVVVIVARLDTTLVKYPVRHYRTLHVDAGILVQNLYLVSTALDLAGCAIAGYDDAVVTDLLSLDETAFPAMLFAVGRQI